MFRQSPATGEEGIQHLSSQGTGDKRPRSIGRIGAMVLASIAGALMLALVVPTPNLGIGGSSPHGSKESIAALELRLQQDPSDIEALLGLASICQSKGQSARAAQYLEAVVAIDHFEKDAYIQLASLYLNNDVLDYESARTALIRLTSLDPGNPEVYLMLGTAQSELGEAKAAILAWQKYLQLVPNGDMAGAVRDQLDTLVQKTLAG